MSAAILRYNGRLEYVLYRAEQRQAVFLSFQEVNRLKELLQFVDLSEPFAFSFDKQNYILKSDEFSRRVFQRRGAKLPFVGEQLELGLYDCREFSPRNPE